MLWNGLTFIPWLLWRCAGECKVSWGGCWRCAMNKFNAVFQRLFCHLNLNKGQNTDPTIVILSKFVLCKFYVSMRRVICWAGPQRRWAFSWGGASPFDPNRERISKVGLRDMLQWALTTFPKLLCQRVKVELDQSGSTFYCNASLEPTDSPSAEDIKAEFQDKYCHNVTFLIANREKISDLIKCRRFWR